ncbi:MAG: hypothetical protein GF329_15955 [Candidatus Lokiarchaeota archaeon]|nr:hypothetical protein [Candidatus Lokiarchaeota archaeon]
MKLQVIKRNNRRYFHVYLPKNIVDHVLKWEKGEELSFSVIEDGLILRKSNMLNFKNDDWSENLKCDNCKILMAFIKGVIRNNELVFVSRCPRCDSRKKIVLPLNEKENWMNQIEETIKICDICNKKELKKVRARYGWDRKSTNYAKIVYFCKNCGIERTKIVPFKILSEFTTIKTEKIELPQIECVYCRYKIEDYDSTTCPNCNNIIICKRCGNFILKRSRYCIHCGEEFKQFIDSKEIETQHCPFCDEIINKGALFCERCGNLVSCIVCGAPINDSSNYCGKCGSNIKRDITLSNLIESE